jgi:PAS domain S-box-containing protein
MAVLLGGAALVLRVALVPLIGDDTPLIVAFPAVVVSAWFGGFVPGVLTFAVAIGGSFVVPGHPQLFEDRPSVLRLAVGLPTVFLVCWLIELLHRGLERAEARAREAEAVQATERRLATVLETAPVFMFDMDRDLRYTWVPRPARGKRADEVIGKRAEDVFPDLPELTSRLNAVRREVMATGRAMQLPIAYATRSGEVAFEMIVSPLTDAEGRVTGVTNLAIDVTARERSERERLENAERFRVAQESALAREREARTEAENANRMKDEFLANLSHELRTPLGTIVGWAEILGRAARGPAAAGTVDVAELVERGAEIIGRSARRQARLIDDLLDMNRILAGKLAIEPVEVDLATVLERAVETVRPEADRKGVRIALEIAPGQVVVRGDAARLEQIFWNLLQNAVKFSHAGGPVRVTATTAGTQADVAVRDEGEGIDPAFMPQIFERFRQADGSASRRHGGLGLGLSIVKNLVALHGGSVRAASDGVGRGTTMTVTLPLAEPVAAAPVAPVESRGVAIAPMASLAGVRVLLVEDDVDSRVVAGMALRGAGARVTEAADGAQALAVLGRGAVDVLLSDLGMPDTDGFTLMRRVREAPALAGNVGVALAYSAFADATTRARAIDVGYRDVLAKPLTPSALASAVALAVADRVTTARPGGRDVRNPA